MYKWLIRSEEYVVKSHLSYIDEEYDIESRPRLSLSPPAKKLSVRRKFQQSRQLRSHLQAIAVVFELRPAFETEGGLAGQILVLRYVCSGIAILCVVESHVSLRSKWVYLLWQGHFVHALVRSHL